MRYDFEFPVATLFANYFLNQCAVQPGGILDQNLCPIVTFFDPMSVDQEDRVVIFVPAGQTSEAGAHFEATVEVYQKTQWSQKELIQNMQTHSGRTNELRDKLFAQNIIGLMAPLFVTGVALDYVTQRKNFTMKIIGSEGGFIQSSTSFDIQGYFTLGT